MQTENVNVASFPKVIYPTGPRHLDIPCLGTAGLWLIIQVVHVVQYYLKLGLDHVLMLLTE